jgi:23S rRNA (adenine2503-C2)-methyltransferase
LIDTVGAGQYPRVRPFQGREFGGARPRSLRTLGFAVESLRDGEPLDYNPRSGRITSITPSPQRYTSPVKEGQKVSLVGMTREELATAIGDRPDANLRAKQIAHHIYARNVDNLDEMKDLPKDLREDLALRFVVQPLTVASHRSSSDGVEKILVHNGDEQVFESVLLPYKDRVSCCISSQVGCPMGCKFCATGLGGFDRNLTAGEIVGQYLMLQHLSERRISHVVFMGMGEPLLNLPNVLKALKLLQEEVGLSYRHLTVSTVGLVPQIYELAKEKLPIHLALSLHSPIDEVRNRLMPVNHKWPVAEVMQAMRQYGKSTGRKITIEYLLIKDVTDTPEQAKALVPLLRGVPSVVNLIPFNWVDTEQGFARPDRDRVRGFRAILERAGINTTERVERGHDIAAACGQLAGQHQGRFARRETSTALPVLS